MNMSTTAFVSPEVLIRNKVAELHASNTLAFIVATGAGAGIQNILSRIPGASKTILGCVFPYSTAALTEFLGAKPEKCSSRETALLMAERAWKKGMTLAQAEGKDLNTVVGLGLTAVVGTNRATRGALRVFVAICTMKQRKVVSIEFEKNEHGFSQLGRECECDLCDMFALNMLLDAALIEQLQFPSRSLKSECLAECQHGHAVLSPEVLPPVWEFGVDPDTDFVRMPDGQIVSPSTLSSKHYVIFEGSFNPLHNGHRRIAEEAKRVTGKHVVFSMCARNLLKGEVSNGELMTRVRQFEQHFAVMVRHEGPRFVDKVKEFPNFTFVIGGDVLQGILDPRYYHIPIEHVLEHFHEHGAHFLVAKRKNGSGFVDVATALARAGVPDHFRTLFTELDVIDDSSSTALREAGVSAGTAASAAK